MEDRCVCCGSIIPEGTMVCTNCVLAHIPKRTSSKNIPLSTIEDTQNTTLRMNHKANE